MIEGYAFEEQLKKSLLQASLTLKRHLHVLGQTTIGSCREQRITYTVEFFMQCKASELKHTLQNNHLPNTWIFVSENQGAFDAVHVQSETHIRFVQCTVEKAHSYYLDIIDSLLRAMAEQDICWTHIEFLVLRPDSDRGTLFCLDPARGGFRDNYFRFDGQPWDRRDYRNNVRYALLHWTEF